MEVDIGLPQRWRHEALAGQLRRAIEAGTFPIGMTLPTERALAQSYGLSRATVREALRALESDGMIRRRQGSGTVVLAAAPRRFMQDIASLETLLDYPANTIVHLDGVVLHPAEPLLESEIGAAAVGNWVRLGLRRYVEGSSLPISLSHVFIPVQYSSVATRVDGTQQPVFRLLEAEYGVRATDISLRIEAVSVPEAMSTLLGVGTGTPAIRILRLYRTETGTPFAMSVTCHPEGRYAFAATLRRSASAH